MMVPIHALQWYRFADTVNMNMARPIRETPILMGKDAERFVKEMKRVESLTPDQRRANREKLYAEVEEINKKWNLTYNALLG